ncbi:MAG: DNA polymerase III subunit gamma/tau [Aquificae bacterium]|nr:DNA polymerase III subunit gamma/tau [Aquificota bacterium]
MAYVPFARKYRPKKFSQVVGQEAPVRILKNAVRSGKVAHAYLFAGPRGVGKTTLARILAKALNCPNAKEGEPCGECEVCREVDRGVFPDLVELDAASNRGIDDVRALKEAVQYKPIKGKHKVYIIDEAHMLTKEAFNALLKTLEEPPPSTVFVLCTTEYDKIPPTILSRCQRILFSRVPHEKIVDYLKDICKKEGLKCEEEALKLIARASEGCMRDAASLLDQAGVYGEGKVDRKVVEDFLGLLGENTVKEFLRMLLESRVDDAIRFLRSLSEKGYNLTKFWEMLEDAVSKAILVKGLKNPEGVINDYAQYEEFKKYPLEALLYTETIINRGKTDARTREPLRAYELAVLKSLIVKDILPVSQLKKALPSKEEQRSEERKPFEKLLESVKDPLVRRILEDAKKEEKNGKLVLRVDRELYERYKKELESLKAQHPFVEFELQEVKKKESDPSNKRLF